MSRYIIFACICITSLHASIENDLYQLYNALQELYRNITPIARVTDKLIEHFREHNHLVWGQHLQHISLENDVLPYKKEIQNAFAQRFGSLSPDDILHGLAEHNVIHLKHDERINPNEPIPIANENLLDSFSPENQFIPWNRVKLYHTQEEEEQENLLHEYKIHLMPRTKDLVHAFSHIIHEYQKLEEKDKTITAMKFNGTVNIGLEKEFYPSDFESPKPIAFVIPRIVMYLIADKQKAENIMAWLLKIFDGWEGIDIYPRFNKKVNSLIYYLQGEGDTRFIDGDYFDPHSNYVFYDKNSLKLRGHFNHDQQQIDNFIKNKLDGTLQLINPHTGKPF